MSGDDQRGVGVFVDRVKSVDYWFNDFQSRGGEKGVVLLAEFFYGRQVQGLPLTAAFMVRGQDFVGVEGFLDLVKKYRRVLGLDKKFFEVEDFIGFYSFLLDDFGYGSLCSFLGVSNGCLYRAARGVCKCYGVDVGRLDDVVLTAESFGYVGEQSVESFACFLGSKDLGEGCGVFRGPRVWAAACLLVSSKVI